MGYQSICGALRTTRPAFPVAGRAGCPQRAAILARTPLATSLSNLGFGISLEFGIWVLGFLFLTAGFQSSAAEPSSAQIQFFENKIRPILANNCYKCHSQQAEKVKAGLLLDTKEGV